MYNNKKSSNKPTHDVYQVIETSKEKGFWTKIGAGWENKDDKGINVSLNSIPLNGQLVIRLAKAKDESDKPDETEQNDDSDEIPF